MPRRTARFAASVIPPVFSAEHTARRLCSGVPRGTLFRPCTGSYTFSPRSRITMRTGVPSRPKVSRI